MLNRGDEGADFFAETTRLMLSGGIMSKTMIGILLSMQRVNAVESITWSRLASASV